MTYALPRIALVAALLGAMPLQAHRLWLLPSATTFSGKDDIVTFDGAASNDLFYADHRPLNPAMVKVWAPDGSAGAILNPASGATRSTFDVKLDKPGTWKIGTTMSGVSGSFKVNGEERRLGGRGGPPGGGPGGPGGPNAAPGTTPPGPPRPPRAPSVASVADIPADATDVKLTESSSRNEVFVTAGAPTTNLFTPTGKGLEMVPVTHPDELVSNEPASFRFLVDGKPAAGLKVTVIAGGKRYREGEEAKEFTTGTDGVVKVAWPMAGMFWLNTTLADKNPSEPRATDRRLSYTTTLEVLAP